MEKDFDGWNERKKQTNTERPRFYRIREMWWCQLGINVGTEQDGNGDNFLRPVIILRGFGPDACLVVPLTTSVREHLLRISVGVIEGEPARANLSQIRAIDTRRFVERIGLLQDEVFREIRKTVRGLF